MRNSYARQLRELKNTPSGAASSKKKKWYLCDAMSFVQDFMGQHKKMASNYDQSAVIEENTKNYDLSESVADFDETNSQHSVISTPSIRPDLNPPKKLKEASNKHYKETAADLVAGPMINFLKSKTGHTDEVLNNSDFNFFKSLIPDMQKLSGKRRREFKTQIMLSLNKFLDEEEDERSRSLSLTSTPHPSPASTDSFLFPMDRNIQAASVSQTQVANLTSYSNEYNYVDL